MPPSSWTPSRRILGWQTSATLRTDLALDALEMSSLDPREKDVTSVVHHSDRGVQYLSIRYTERLAEAGVVTSVRSRGDSYDNALAESANRPVQDRTHQKARALEEPERGVEYATLEWVDWFNHRRLLEPIGHMPPAELEEMFYRGEVPVTRPDSNN